jgi:hypothetical protein
METVPGFRLRPGMVMPPTWQPTPGEPNPYEDPQWRLDHKAYARRLRDEVRPEIHERGRRDPNFAHIERLKCADDPNYFGMVYGWIQDPQPLPDEEQDKPYAKFAYQCDNTDLQRHALTLPRSQRTKWWRTKSRQLGISWDDEHFDTWFYLFMKGLVKIVSRSEEWVDNGTSTQAMMGKIKYILTKISEHSPYILPTGYTILELLSPPNYKHRNLINPVTGTSILGESTTAKVARGGTYTYGRPDEDAFIPKLDQTLTSMQGSCPQIFLASTEDFGEGMSHFEGWQAAKTQAPETVREYNWHQNAYLDTAWERDLLASAKTEEQRLGIMREVFRDPFAGFGPPGHHDGPGGHRRRLRPDGGAGHRLRRRGGLSRPVVLPEAPPQPAARRAHRHRHLAGVGRRLLPVGAGCRGAGHRALPLRRLAREPRGALVL